MTTFPSNFTPDTSTRAGRMIAAGRVKVTVTNLEVKTHVTVLLKCFADNRDRTFDPKQNKNWVSCRYEDATHVFAEVPNASTEWNDKIGTYYPRTGKWFDAPKADSYRVEAAALIAHWLMTPTWPAKGYTFLEASECGACGLELTDPVSIERGIGPTCYGKVTGSQHQVKESAMNGTGALDEAKAVEVQGPDGIITPDFYSRLTDLMAEEPEILELMSKLPNLSDAAFTLIHQAILGEQFRRYASAGEVRVPKRENGRPLTDRSFMER